MKVAATRTFVARKAAIIGGLAVLGCVAGAIWFIAFHSSQGKPLPVPSVKAEARPLRLQTFTHQLPVALVTDMSWKSRIVSVNGIERTYVFGAGNPTDLRIGKEDLASYFAKPDASGHLPYGYVSDQTEQALADFLGDPMLKRFVEACERFLPIGDANNIFGKPFPTVLAMDGLLYIDPNSGRKELDFSTLDMVAQYFQVLDNPLLADGELQGWRECLQPDEYDNFEKLQGRLSDVFRNYLPQ